jgi:hypothetical protein
MAISSDLRGDSSVRYTTSLAVLGEFLTVFSKDLSMRGEAAAFVDRIRGSADTDVILGDENLFNAALNLYRRRLERRIASSTVYRSCCANAWISSKCSRGIAFRARRPADSA